MRVGMLYGKAAYQTGIERYARKMVDAVRKAGVDAEDVPLARREWRIAGRAVGGMASLWIDRARFRRGSWDLLHALDPAVATRGTDIVTVHDLLIETHADLVAATRAERLDWAVTRRLARRARWFCCVSDSTRQAIVGRWGVDPERAFVTYSGLDPDVFRANDAPTGLIAPAKVNLAYVGDDHPRKNLMLALRGMVALRERHGLESRFVRFGPARYPRVQAEMEAFARAHALDVVQPGFVEDGVITAVLTQADAFVWPSVAEGFGLPPLEAMACGAPVAALDLPVTREICGARASYHANEPAAFADAVADLRAGRPDPAAQRAWALRYSWDETAKRHLAVYERAMAAR